MVQILRMYRVAVSEGPGTDRRSLREILVRADRNPRSKDYVARLDRRTRLRIAYNVRYRSADEI